MSLSLPFPSFFLGGFECSTHRRPSGRRIDVIDASRHDLYADADYRRLRQAGLLAARDGLRWHLIEQGGGFQFHSARRQVQAARDAGIQVVWDLMHYGYPDDLSPLDAQFPERFARYARAAAEFLRGETVGPLWLCPINELSFMAWGGGEVGYMNPFAHRRGDELKAQLVRASLAAVAAAREVDPQVRFLHAEPLIHVRAHPGALGEAAAAQAEHEAQFAAVDWLTGRARPELGGAPEHVDLLGLNIYPYNQWRRHVRPELREVLEPSHPEFVPLAEQLRAVYRRYGLPLMISETGAEDGLRAPWLEMVTAQVLAARGQGVPVGGICLYPVVNHPGWDDDRHCHNGLWDYPQAGGERPADPAYAQALAVAQTRVAHSLQAHSLQVPPPAADGPATADRRAEARGPLRHTEAMTRFSEPSPASSASSPHLLPAALSRLEAAAPAILGEAAARDADGRFPEASFAALRSAGLLTACLPVACGGGGLTGTDLLTLLRAVGRLSLPVGRVFEGHVNALGLIQRYGTPEQRRGAAADAAAGELFGVWNTEEAPGLWLHLHPDAGEAAVAGADDARQVGTLQGGKTFTSGAWWVTRPLCPAETLYADETFCPAEPPGPEQPAASQGRRMVLLQDLPPQRFDAGFWQPAGMRASVSYRADLSGWPVTAGDLIGAPGDYYAQPDFGGGALRFLAVQLGGAQAALHSVRLGLRRAGRAGDDVQRLRFAAVAASLEAAWQTTLEGQRRLDRLGQDPDPARLDAALAYVSLARVVAEDACLQCAEACERAAGARGLLPPLPTERILRDLRLYLRQPAPDAARLGLGAFVLDAAENLPDPLEAP